MNNIPRWQYRFVNFSRALSLLKEAILVKRINNLSNLEKEGLIQRFEYTWELTWKVLKDYLEYEGIIFNQITPSAVIKEAIAANLIEEGDIWMEALNSRNKMSHTYNIQSFEEIIAKIDEKYLNKLEDLHFKLSKFIKDYDGQ